MALNAASSFGIKLTQKLSSGVFAPALQNAVNLQQLRYRRTKHWNPKWKKMRSLKVVKIELPKFNEKPGDVSEEEIRMKMKERGIYPPRPWMERPFYLSATGGIFEAYVPPEGDGKISPITAQGAKQKLQFLEKKTKTMMAIRKIRSYEEDFDAPEFCTLAESVYKKAHEYMVDRNYEKLEEVVTERAYPEILHNVEDKTIHWKFLKSVELPRIVHARCTDIITKENIFAQVTVRFHTQQLLAMYDRFGRLMHGSEILAKDVLEYVVFEKHLSNEYGSWRLHDKILPAWLPVREPSARTHRRAASQRDVDVVHATQEEVKELLAMYDRFGRLMHGSEILAKDVLEYVVFEKHVSNEYGSWRLHDKILPAWLPVREPSARTHRRAASQRDVDVVHATQEEVKEVGGDKSGNV